MILFRGILLRSAFLSSIPLVLFSSTIRYFIVFSLVFFSLPEALCSEASLISSYQPVSEDLTQPQLPFNETSETIPDWTYVLLLLIVFLLLGIQVFYKNQGKSVNQIALPFAAVVLILTAVALSWAVSFESRSFQMEQNQLAESTVQGVTYNFGQLVAQKRHIVQAMVEHERSLLHDIAEFPADEDNMALLLNEVGNRLADYFSFMLTDSDGNSLLQEKLLTIGPACQQGIQLIAQSDEPPQEILVTHGTHNDDFHFDVMAKIGSEKDSPIFFVSFKIDSMVQLLRTSQIPGQSLLVVLDSNPQAVEMSVDGIKQSVLFGKKLTKPILDSIIYQMQVPGTGWRILALPNHNLFSNYNAILSSRAFYTYLGLLIIVGLFLWRLWSEEKSRRVAENELLLANEMLEYKVEQRTVELMTEHERAVVTLNSIADGVISTDIDGVIDLINPVAEELTGWDSRKAIGQPISRVFNVVDEKTGKEVINPVVLCLKIKALVKSKFDIALVHKNGMHISIEDRAAPIHNARKSTIGAILVFHDVTQSREHANEIKYHANHDPLTGLLNRREFDNRMEKTFQRFQENGGDYVLLYMDLDRFKLVNDTAGHAAGDELLKQLTELLMASLRQRDTFARLGGDEFGVLLEHCCKETGLRIANKLRKSVEDFRFVWKKQVFRIGVSVGLMPFLDTIDSADGLISEADAACYLAKKSGRNRVQLYDASAQKKLGESYIVNKLTYAFENDRLQLFQQRIKVADGAQSDDHYEVLVRLLGDDDELILPAAFLPTAERYGLATSLDRWVIKTSFNWLTEHQAEFTSKLVLAINLSGQSITDIVFKDYVREQFSLFPIEPSSICFEITETAAMHNLENAINFIRNIKELGCQFALDDFGSGHAAYAQLKYLPVDYLKIDGSLVKDIIEDKIDFSIVKSVNEMGHVLGMKTIAEFVENEQISEKLIGIGVNYLQGYGIARPAPLDELLANHN